MVLPQLRRREFNEENGCISGLVIRSEWFRTPIQGRNVPGEQEWVTDCLEEVLEVLGRDVLEGPRNACHLRKEQL